MRNIAITSLAALFAMAGAGAAHASVSFTFDTGNQSWTTGNVSSPTPDLGTHAASWSGGRLTAADEAGETGVYAPGAVLGNQSAAYGGSISFDVSDAFNDGVAYTGLILYGANGFAAAVMAGPPSTDNGTLTTYNFALNETVFSQFSGGNGVGGAISQAQFQAILSNLAGVAFRTEYNTGADDSRFDNAIFNGFVDPNAPAGVPEPASWAMFIAGFGAIGRAMRRLGKTYVTFA